MTSDPITDALAALGEEIDTAGDPAKAVLLAYAHHEAWRAAQKVLADRRRMTMRAAQRAGLDRATLADLVGISRQRVAQITESPTRERERQVHRERRSS
jgi:hypothetical protein